MAPVVTLSRVQWPPRWLSPRSCRPPCLTGTEDRTAPEPVGPPYEVSTTHPLTYALGATIHYGERTVDAPGEVVELDVTDAGVVARTADGGIWFTDGQDLEQVGTLGEPGSAYADADFPFGSSWGFVVSDNTGARAAWLEFPQPGEPELVVYDTENAEETAREPLGVDPGSYALLAGVTDRYGYWYSTPESIEDEPFPDQRIDLGSGATRGGVGGGVRRRPARAQQPTHHDGQPRRGE